MVLSRFRSAISGRLRRCANQPAGLAAHDPRLAPVLSAACRWPSLAGRDGRVRTHASRLTATERSPVGRHFSCGRASERKQAPHPRPLPLRGRGSGRSAPLQTASAALRPLTHRHARPSIATRPSAISAMPAKSCGSSVSSSPPPQQDETRTNSSHRQFANPIQTACLEPRSG